MIVKTAVSNKNNTKQKTALEYNKYQEQLQANIDSRILGVMREGKKVTPQLEQAITKKVTEMFSSEYRVKGTRTGHLNNAPVSVQEKVAEISRLIDQVEDWMSTNKNGEAIKVKLSLLTKEVAK